MSAGTYQLSIGNVFYIGSGIDLKRRLADHKWRLRAGIHPCKKLQKAFNDHPGDKSQRGLKGFDAIKFTPTSFIRQNHNDSSDQFRSKLRTAEQIKLDENSKNPYLANGSLNAFGPDCRDDMKARWQDPKFREYMAKINRERLMQGVSDETRRKMALAKTGSKNSKSRPVIVTHPDGSLIHFESASDAAKFFNVKQQTFDLWIKGKIPWPGHGRYVRKEYAWISPYSARFSDAI